MKKISVLSLTFLSAIFLSLSSATAVLLGPLSSAPPDVFPTLPGVTLLASLTTASTSTNGKVTFDLVTAVYRDPGNIFGAGDLDFVYQVQNSANSIDAIARVTAIDFTGFLTDVGYTPVGSALPGGLFTNGTSAAPQFVDRSLSGGTIGFTFNLPLPLPILPGQTSTALIIETNATMFRAGSFNVIDGGVSTVAAFEPTRPVPDSGSTAVLLSLGMIGLFAAYRALGWRSIA